MRRLGIYVCLAALVASGCGGAAVKHDKAPAAKAEARVDKGAAGPGSPAGVGSGGESALPKAGALERKIIYTADVDLVVEEFDEVPSQVKDLVKQFGAYVARSNVSGMPGSPRSGQWTIRVPVARYEDFLAAARGLGEVRSVRSDSQDVSEEFYDVQARIRNKKEEEDRLRKHLADSTGKLEDILAVERELSRVREEAERMEGRLRVLSDLTSLTTINLRVDEIKGYVPEEAPTYGTRVRRALDGSISSLVSTAEGLSIAVVAAFPWLVVLAVAVFVLVLLMRILVRVLFRRTR